MNNSVVPANEPIVESVLEWTIARDAEDIGVLMNWISKANKKRERETLIQRTRELLAEIEHAARRLDDLR
ncbi:MAG: hypothetical protein ACJZ49_02090 [Candidatus Thalassarchaeaceae archaeon]|nr:MAG: hypothetical protein CMA04_006075 [Euryarchaeota archaeon]RPG74782.1 MAG: hypothetical protein CBC45_003705 [Euryarchaeota archaeon TMED85]|tara:strand:- start:6766 stop:6975 length:210 start_codon:yes stop_codon:yes gene_type:complete